MKRVRAPRHPTIETPAARWRRAPALVIVASLVGAITVGVGFGWYRLFPPKAENVVDVYQSRHCTCAPGWIRLLEQQGFVVRVSTTNTLRKIRNELQIPAALNGCHLGIYLNYVLEGHVAGEAVRDLAIHRPASRGLVTQAAWNAAQSHTNVVDYESPVLLLDRNGVTSSVWYRR
ncbi:MAG: hypothetical protein JSR66_32905 [Proteobacteria bacterium]|nr:hypothetical protein [Pseudomonadota bacterium]